MCPPPGSDQSQFWWLQLACADFHAVCASHKLGQLLFLFSTGKMNGYLGDVASKTECCLGVETALLKKLGRALAQTSWIPGPVLLSAHNVRVQVLVELRNPELGYPNKRWQISTLMPPLTVAVGP
jgi:hypothetical protein